MVSYSNEITTCIDCLHASGTMIHKLQCKATVCYVVGVLPEAGGRHGGQCGGGEDQSTET